MTTLLTEDFEGGASGATATSTNTAFSDASTATPTFDSSQFIIGAQSVLFNPSAAVEYLQHSWTAGATMGLRFYIYVPTLPGAATFLASVQSTATIRAGLRLNTDGTLTVRNNVTAAASTTAAITAATWYRVEWLLDNGAATQSLRLYVGHSPTAMSGGDVTGTYNQGTINRLLLGVPASGTINWYADAAKLVDTATYADLGPAATNATAPPAFVPGVASVFTPTVSLGARPLPGVVNGVASVPAMAGVVSVTLGPDAVSRAAVIFTPTVSLQSNALALPVRVQATAAVFSPAQVFAQRFAIAPPGIVTAIAQVPAPDASSDLNATPDTINVFAVVRTPNIVAVSPTAYFVTDFGGTFTPPSPDYPRSMSNMTTVPVGSTVLRVAGQWVVTVFPSEELVNSADRVYRGGRRYALTQGEVADLTAAGFGSHIQLES